MDVTKDLKSSKKTYSKPTCNSKSIAEISDLLREEFADPTDVRRTARHGEAFFRPALLVWNFVGNSSEIDAAIENNGMRCHRTSVEDGVPLLQVLLGECQNNGQVPTSVLLLDLRRANHAPNRVLESVSKHVHLNGSPLAILVDEEAVFPLWEGFDVRSCWQLGGPADPDLLGRALKSFLDLWALVRKGLPHGQEYAAKTG